MFVFRNPALEEFVAAVGPELVLGQVCIRRVETGHQLRHVADESADSSQLRAVAIDDLRALAQYTRNGAFRPLKSAPNLQSGWWAQTRTNAELERALNHLYPGAVADWYAARRESEPVTHYREFTARQSGMYRITTLLSDAQAADMIQACCDVCFCLKRRRWTVEGLEVDTPAEKSLIPCFEPCAILLEFARKATRLQQEEKVATTLSASELETLQDSLEAELKSNDGDAREADFNAPDNRRRRQLVLRRIQRMLSEVVSRRPSGGDSTG